MWKQWKAANERLRVDFLFFLSLYRSLFLDLPLFIVFLLSLSPFLKEYQLAISLFAHLVTAGL